MTVDMKWLTPSLLAYNNTYDNNGIPLGMESGEILASQMLSQDKTRTYPWRARLNYIEELYYEESYFTFKDTDAWLQVA